MDGWVEARVRPGHGGCFWSKQKPFRCARGGRTREGKEGREDFHHSPSAPPAHRDWKIISCKVPAPKQCSYFRSRGSETREKEDSCRYYFSLISLPLW
jgi:hypothetical protein